MQSYFLIRATNGHYFKTAEEASYFAPQFEPYTKVFITEEADDFCLSCNTGKHFIVKVWNNEKKEELIDEWETGSYTSQLCGKYVCTYR